MEDVFCSKCGYLKFSKKKGRCVMCECDAPLFLHLEKNYNKGDKEK